MIRNNIYICALVSVMTSHFATKVFAKEKPMSFGPESILEKSRIYWIDWNKEGKTSSKRIEILDEYEGKVKLDFNPYSINWGEYGVEAANHVIPQYQMAVEFYWKSTTSNRTWKNTLFVGRECEVEYFVGNQRMKDSILVAIYSGATKISKKPIFKSKGCKTVLSRATKSKG